MTYQQILDGNRRGYSGVRCSRNGQAWCARIVLKGKTTHIGTYRTYKEAVSARKLAEQQRR